MNSVVNNWAIIRAVPIHIFLSKIYYTQKDDISIFIFWNLGGSVELTTKKQDTVFRICKKSILLF